MESHENIVIVGGGIAGLSLALALHSFSVTSKDSGAPTAHVSYGGNHEVRCVKRRVLLETFARELPIDTIRFSSKVVNIQESDSLKLLHLADGSTLKTMVLIGCEGVNSVVARWLGFNKPVFTNRWAIRGYLHSKGNHGLNQELLQFTGHGYRYGIVPCDATSVYWFFNWSSAFQDEEVKQNPTKMKEFVLSNLGRVQDNIKAIFEKTEVENIIYSQLSYRSPWELLWGNISKDNVCVAGDAFHAMTPDIGQGDQDADGYKKIDTSLKKYAKDRRWRGMDLVTTAYIVCFLQ